MKINSYYVMDVIEVTTPIVLSQKWRIFQRETGKIAF